MAVKCTVVRKMSAEKNKKQTLTKIRINENYSFQILFEYVCINYENVCRLVMSL